MALSCSCSSDQSHSLGMSIGCRCSSKKKNTLELRVRSQPVPGVWGGGGGMGGTGRGHLLNQAWPVNSKQRWKAVLSGPPLPQRVAPPRPTGQGRRLAVQLCSPCAPRAPSGQAVHLLRDPASGGWNWSLPHPIPQKARLKNVFVVHPNQALPCCFHLLI